VIEGVTGRLTSGAITPLAMTAGAGIPTVAGGASTGLLGRLAFGGPSALRGIQIGGVAPGVGGFVIPGTAILAGGVGIGLATLPGAYRSGSIAGGALGGAASGAMIGFAFGGPIGAVFGAELGALLGWIGRGKAKRKATAIEVPFEQAASDLFEQFKKHEVDFESVVGGLELLIQQGQQAELSAGLGKWGKKGAENLTKIITDLIAAVQNLQKQRETNAGGLSGMTIPEYAIGGQVLGARFQGSGLGQGILAFLHPGEFVMRREAVDLLGTNFLAGLNRAPRFDSGGAVGGGSGGSGGSWRVQMIFPNVQNASGFAQALQRNRGALVRLIRQAEADGAL